MLISPGRALNRRFVLCIIAFGFAVGCKQEDIHVYRVPKETQETPVVAQAAPHDPQEASASHPQWTVPAGWETRPPASAMLIATFGITGKDGQTAIVSVTPLPSIAGHELELVNMWRGQVQLAPVNKDDVPKQTEPVAIGSEQGLLYDMVSEKPLNEGKSLLRLTVAMISRGDTCWFFKLTGDDALAREQKPAFLQFLKSIDFSQAVESVQFAHATHPVSTNSREVPHENPDKPLWNVPPGWQEVPAGGMLVAKFSIPGDNGAKAELNISPTGGGVLMNVNRWRGQLGLEPVSDADLPRQTQSLDVLGGQAMLVDMTGTDKKSGQKTRLLGAIVPRGSQTWYYKLMGNEQVVEKERAAFTQFLKTIKYGS